MALIREADLPTFLKQRLSGAVGLLVYGGNETGIMAVADRVIEAFGRDTTVRRFDGATLRSDGALLDEAFRSLSLLGERELIVVDDADDALAKTSAAVLAAAVPGNFILLLAGSLAKNSTLRVSAESASKFFCLSVYDPHPGSVMQQVHELLRKDGLRLSTDAAEAYQSFCGADLGQALREAAKLAIYAMDSEEITAADVVACCGDLRSSDLDAVIDASLAGDFETLDRVFAGLPDAEQKSLFPLLANHLVRLENIRADYDRSGSLEGALRQARPPVFFGRKVAVTRQVRQISLDALLAMHGIVESNVALARRTPDLASQIAARSLFAIAQRARTEMR